MMRALLLRGGHVVDPSSGIDRIADVRVTNGVVAEVGELVLEPSDRVVDVDGLVVAPGLVDVHVHLREPGHEWKETIGTGTASAAAAGFTTIFCMPNTDPALDSVVALEELQRRTDSDAVVRVRPIAAISEGRRSERAVDFEALARAGAVGFSDDGDSTASSAIMRSALKASEQLALPVMVHCEDPSLTGGAMHEGEVSKQLGVRGLAPEAEEIIIGRDLALAKMTRGWLHVCHVSTGRGADLIAAAKQEGVRVTAEVMPHHLTMSDEWVAGCRELKNVDELVGAGTAADTNTKVNPPLRPTVDTRRLLSALKLGTIDIVATDHAPHGYPEKEGRTLAAAAFGLTGIEFALPSMLALVRAGHFTLSDVVRFLSTVPARLWRLGSGTLRPGVPADIFVFDPEESWEVRPDSLVSRGANTPLMGMTLRGRTKLTFVGGEERYRDW